MKGRYFKVMFGNVSGADPNLVYKLDEVNIANHWNPDANDSHEMGGFNFSVEDKMLRWLVRGDTLYDVEIPMDAMVIDCPSESASHGVFRTNKIILSNPRKMTDELAMYFYKKSKLPEKSYYKALAGLMVRGYENTCLELIRDRVNLENIDLVLSEIKDFIGLDVSNGNSEVYYRIMEILNEIKSDLLICLNINKDPYIKDLTDDKVINLTGESGSGKSYFSNRYISDNNYIIIDTDVIFNNMSSDNKESLEIRELFKGKSKDCLITDFDHCYKEILEYFKDRNKIIVIDSAQFRNVKDYSILKGKVIIMRTCIDTCYVRCMERYCKRNPNATLEEKQSYANKKSKMFHWYKGLNQFISKIDRL